MGDKSEMQIVQEAPRDKEIGEALAFYCTNCPWWTTDGQDAVPGEWERDVKSRTETAPMLCPKCKTKLAIPTSLEFFIESHREANDPIGFQKFLSTFHQNSHWRESE